MRYLLCIILLSTSQSLLAQNLEDVIYLKNGSIVRGEIIEHHIINNQYKIQIEDGSIFSFQQADIIKIRKEPLFNSKKESVSSEVSVNHNLTANHSTTNNHQQTLPAIEHTLSIGNLWHSVSSPTITTNSYSGYETKSDQVERYNGIKLNYQMVHTRHIASRYALEYAKLDRIESIDSNDAVLDANHLVDDNRYTGLIATLVASSNLQRGWRIYVGAGLYNHHYTNENTKDRNYIGTRFELGGGYMWKDLFLLLQYQWHGSEQYPEEVNSIFSGGLEIGMAF